jgi:hypothetical protein
MIVIASMNESFKTQRRRPIMTSGLISSERPSVAENSPDSQRDFLDRREHWEWRRKNHNLGYGPDALRRAQELLDLRNEVAPPAKLAVFNTISELDKESALNINLDAVQERLDMSQVSFEEATEWEKPNNMAADYNLHLRKASVPIRGNTLNTDEKHLLLHELTHAASCQLYAGRMYGEYFGGYFGLVSGLNRSGNSSWLNEAITQSLAIITARREDIPHENVSTYMPEVFLFNRILIVGNIKFKDFLPAYFEEPQLDNTPGQRMREWHILQQRISDVFGPRYLQRIDEFIGDYEPGTEKTVRKIIDLCNLDAVGLIGLNSF